MIKIGFSKQVDKCLNDKKISSLKLKEILKKLLNYLDGELSNLDIKKLKGNWKNFYRIRKGKIRIILKIDVDKNYIYIEKIDFRGDVYK